MKKTRKIQLDNGFYIAVTVKNTNDNYNQFTSIFKGIERMPLFGTCFKNTDTNEKIKAWANERINAPHNQQCLSQFINQ